MPACRPPTWDSVIIATGPLTSPALSAAIQELTGEGELAFFDAIAPIVHLDSIDPGITWRQSRYDKAGPGGTGADYINCPMSKAEYEAFLDALLAAEKTCFKEWEASTPYFEGCLPIEVMAERGRETLRFGPMKPVGLSNPHRRGERPYAVVQLRQDNALGTLWNMVGFQTKLKHGEQARIFRLIPGLAQAEFARLGGLHRNTFLNSPKLLDAELRLRVEPRLRFAGQITGCEGYVESAAIGLLAGRAAAAERLGAAWLPPPPTTAFGALLGHITGGHLAAEARRRSLLPADERQLRPVPAACPPAATTRPATASRARSAGRPRSAPLSRARSGRSRRLAWPAAKPRRRRVANNAAGSRRRIWRRNPNQDAGRPFRGMNVPANWPRNRLLLALPEPDLKQLLPDLEHIECKREQVLIDADSSLDHVFFPDSGVISVVAVYPDGSIIEMATIGREGGTGFQAVFGAKTSSARLLVQVPGTAAKMPRQAFVRAMDALPAFLGLVQAHVLAFLEQVMVSAACNGAHNVGSAWPAGC